VDIHFGPGGALGPIALIESDRRDGPAAGPAARPHWSELASDPNARPLQHRRQQELDVSHRASVRDRTEAIADLCRDKVVLNLGCADQLAEGVPLAPLHRRLTDVARRCVGVDIVQAHVRTLQAEGLEVVLADATDPAMADVVGGPFDVVVAGEIIEHVLNVGGLMAAARAVLTPGGVLVVTTPNPHVVWASFRGMVGRYGGNVDHVNAFCPYEIAEIADRTGFELTAWYSEYKPDKGKRGLLLRAAHLVTRLRPRSSADCATIIYLLTPLAR
jgi:2-polyprenyl-3-methyl-5-hydroxy-6-metoxy-1,4-benzoquinol methylase